MYLFELSIMVSSFLQFCRNGVRHMEAVPFWKHYTRLWMRWALLQEAECPRDSFLIHSVAGCEVTWMWNLQLQSRFWFRPIPWERSNVSFCITDVHCMIFFVKLLYNLSSFLQMVFQFLLLQQKTKACCQFPVFLLKVGENVFISLDISVFVKTAMST